MIALLTITLGSMIAVVLYQSHFDTFSAKRFLVDYFILWGVSMLAITIVSIIFYTTHTDKVYYAKITKDNTYLQVTSRQYTTKFLGEDSLTYSPPKQVTVEEVPKGISWFEPGRWNR